jgi:adenylate cyclase
MIEEQLHDFAATAQPEFKDQEVLAQLDRILGSSRFSRSPRLRAFLDYAVRQTLEGHGDLISGTRIALNVFGRDNSFDSNSDPLIRVQARNLRLALHQYYQDEGRKDLLRIEIPKGQYAASFAEPDKNGFEVTEPTLAVLPFISLGDAMERPHFADGLTQELITAFNQYADLAVLIRQCVESYKGFKTDIRRIGEELDVRFALRGSVRMNGDMVRINAQLMDTKTGQHLWSRDFDHELTARNLFEVQDNIACDVASRITSVYGILFHTLETETRGRRPQDLSVYEAILRFYRYNSILSKAAYESARTALLNAVDIEPTLALPWALLAEIYVDGWWLGLADDEAPLIQAETSARKAIEHDPKCQHAYWSLVQVHFHNRETTACRECLEKVLELNPNATFFVGGAGWQLALIGDWERGLGILQDAMDLSSNLPGWFYLAPYQNCYRQGDFEGALAYAIRFNTPTLAWDQVLRAAAYQRMGDSKSAGRAVSELLGRNSNFEDRATAYIRSYVYLDDLAEDIYQALLEAGMPRPAMADT